MNASKRAKRRKRDRSGRFAPEGRPAPTASLNDLLPPYAHAYPRPAPTGPVIGINSQLPNTGNVGSSAPTYNNKQRFRGYDNDYETDGHVASVAERKLQDLARAGGTPEMHRYYSTPSNPFQSHVGSWGEMAELEAQQEEEAVHWAEAMLEEAGFNLVDEPDGVWGKDQGMRLTYPNGPFAKVRYGEINLDTATHEVVIETYEGQALDGDPDWPSGDTWGVSPLGEGRMIFKGDDSGSADIDWKWYNH